LDKIPSLQKCLESPKQYERFGCGDLAQMVTPERTIINPYKRVMINGERVDFLRHPELLLNRFWFVWLEKIQYWEKHKNAPCIEDRTTKSIEAEKYFDNVSYQFRIEMQKKDV
jgi:hypothetical protein